MWEYITKKIHNEGENVLKINSNDNYIQAYIHHLNQIDESHNLKKELEAFVSDESHPEEERAKAEI